MDIFPSVVAAAFGLVIGSFFNVLIYRLPRNESIVRPGSHCPDCNHAIKPWENIPLMSYLFLRGRCPACGHRISLQYPAVELLTGCAALALWRLVISPGIASEPSGWHMGILALQSLALLMLIPLSVIDMKHYIIPDAFTLPGIVAAFIVSFFPGGLTPLQCLLGMAVGCVPLFLVGHISKLLLKKEALGLGDIWLMAVIGGLWGWKIAVAAVVLASFSGSIAGFALLAFRALSKDHKLPFGPFLAFGAWASVLTFDTLFKLYCSWLG